MYLKNSICFVINSILINIIVLQTSRGCGWREIKKEEEEEEHENEEKEGTLAILRIEHNNH